jgi:ectoine hydroxylase-related dioxygenase (phytanoyl-CoA dioxygenase family)
MIIEDHSVILKRSTSTDPVRRQAFYEQYGFILVKGAFPRAQCEAYRQELHGLAGRLQAKKDINATWRGSWLKPEERERVTILHCHDVQFYLSSFSRLLVDDRLLAPVADLIGPNIQLHHTKMFIKPPERGSPFPMHQDYHYFPHARHTMLAAVLHFDDAPLEKGCIRVMPGSNKLGPLETVPDGLYLPPHEWPLEQALPVPCEAGDLLVFNYLTVHGSGINESGDARTTCLFQLRDPTDPPTEQKHLSRGQGMMLRGIDPLNSG